MNAKIMINMQLKGRKKARTWSKKERKLAITIYYKSPSCYNYMRRNGVILPSPVTVRRWLRTARFMPGINPRYLKNLKMKCETLDSVGKKCVIILDEMAIKKNLEFNDSLDLVEGFEDLGKIGRSSILATQALVFLVRGLFHKWKFPLAFYLTKGATGSILKTILEEVVDELRNIGFDPKLVVCDQASSNRKMYDMLGVTEDNPEVTIGKSGDPILCMYDVPHLVKSVRNNLLSDDFIYSGKRISMKDIKKTFLVDQTSETCRALPKVTKVHINPNNFKKMSCKLATQIFSKSMAAAITVCHATGQLQSDSAVDTAEFVELMNNTFDTLNSQNLYERNPHKRPLSNRNTLGFKNLNDALNVFKEIKKENSKKPTESLTRPPCFGGFVTTINAILQLYSSQVGENSRLFLMTSRLNQDPIENLFSIIRQKNGYNKNPTTLQFRTAFQATTCFSFIKFSDYSNCEEDDDDLLSGVPDVLSSEDGQIEGLISDGDPSLSGDSGDEKEYDDDYERELEEDPLNHPLIQFNVQPTLEDCSTAYVAGYLAKKLLDHDTCEKCEKKLLDGATLQNPTSALILAKTFDCVTAPDALKHPSLEMTQFTANCLNFYVQAVNDIKHEVGVLRKLVAEAQSRIKDAPFSEECSDHKKFVITTLFKVKLFKDCKWFSKDQYSTTLTSNSKLRIVKNQ